MALRSSKRGRYQVFENLGEVSRDELETLRRETRRLAKVANQRLVRMDRESRFGLSPAATRTYEDLRTEFGAPRRRYRESLATATREELIREYKSLREFVTSKTSTVAGYTKLIMERWKAFRSQTGADISVDDYVEAWEKITADDKARETFYRSQFALIKEASDIWNAEKARAAEAGTDPETSYQAILASTLEEWNGKSFIQTLRSAREKAKQ